MAKLYSTRLEPLRDVVLVRVPDAGEGLVFIPTTDASGKVVGATKKKQAPRWKGHVVAIGPGCWEFGVFVKPDERLKVGSTVLFDPNQALQPEDVSEWKDEQLFFLPMSAIVFIEH